MGALHGVDGHFALVPPPVSVGSGGLASLSIGSQESRRRGIAAGAGSDTLGDDRLICRDVVRGHVLDGDLLLASASVVVEPFGQHHDRPRRLVRKLQIFRARLEILWWLCPTF